MEQSANETSRAAEATRTASTANKASSVPGPSTIATIGPAGSDSCRAALQYCPEARLLLFNRIADALAAFENGQADYTLIPVYNTREGEVKDYFRMVAQMFHSSWIDNVVLPIHLSLATAGKPADGETTAITTIVGRNSVLKQSEEYINSLYPEATQMAVYDIEQAMNDILANQRPDYAVIDSEELLKQHGFHLLAREVAAHNRTRFAVIGGAHRAPSGYDATAIITRPLRDRVGMLADILGEFTRRGINILDLQTENDIKTQKLRIYVEVEGHQDGSLLAEALKTIESSVIQEPGSLKVLGSFPRVDMRVKQIGTIGFIGSGDMSKWFAEHLENEGYETIITGRSTPVSPEEMIAQVNVVMVCVPISVTADIIRHYGPMLHDGQALVILAGESENTIAAALETTSPGVEIMFIHNLWGPLTVSMKDKNVSVVRTSRSGAFCSELEAFLYKHGAEIQQDSAKKHDLLMGVGQKLPTTVSVALGMTLRDHNIDYRDISSHTTLTSLYGILAMARVHNQNARTYAEIMATGGDGRKIVRSFAENLLSLIDHAEAGEIDTLSSIIEENRKAMPSGFIQNRMKQAKTVDEMLSVPSAKVYDK